MLRGATFHAAQVLGMDERIGSIRVGKLADLVITEYNPLSNFKVLYGTGHFRLGDDDKPERVGGVKYTIKSLLVTHTALTGSTGPPQMKLPGRTISASG